MAGTRTPQVGPSTDLGALWTKAVNDYAQKTGNRVDRLKSQSLNDVMDATNKEMKTFGGFRHDDGKIDKVRSAFRKHLGLVQKCMNGLQAAGTAAGAFPPAMPVGIVFSACGHLLSAFAAASAQFDKVESFFNHMSRFFERLSLLEGKAGLEPLGLAIVRVFSTQLSICGIAQRLASSGRVKTFFNMLWSMEDPELSAAYAAMQSSIEELGTTVGYASYSAIRDTHEDVGKMSDNIDSLDARIVEFRSTLTQDVHTLYMSSLALDVKITEGFATIGTKQDQSYELQLSLAQKQDRLMKAIMKTTPAADIADLEAVVSDTAVKAATHIRSYFERRPKIYPDFLKVYDANLEQHEFVERVIVKTSSAWLFSDATYLDWRTAPRGNVWLQASDGTGKTFATCAASHDIVEQFGDSASCGYFYFFPRRESVETALACMVMQIVGRNARYAEAMAAQLRDEEASPQSVPAGMTTWERFFTSRFLATDTSNRLFLLIDGFDEALEDQKKLLIDLAERSATDQARVSMFLTTRRSVIPRFGSLSLPIIQITKERVMPALEFMIRKWLDSRPQLKRLSKGMKKKITRELLSNADSMLYAGHMLQRYAYIDRESRILRALDNIPKTLTGLFELFEQESIRGRTNEQLTILRTIFMWMTYSQRALTLSDVSIIVAHTAQSLRGRGTEEKLRAMREASLLHNEDEIIDIEDEIRGRCNRFFRVSRQPLSSESAIKDEGDSDTEEEEVQIADIDDDPRMIVYRSAEVVFQDFATRRFFLHSLHDDESSKQTLRTHATEAHLSILETCVDAMLSEGETRFDKSAPNGLRQYALNFWTVHLDKLSIESEDDVVIRVVRLFHRISANATVFAGSLLSSSVSFEKVLPDRQPDWTPWYDQCALWVGRSSSLRPDTFTSDVQQWLKYPANDLLLLPVASGLSKIWLGQVNAGGFLHGYSFTRRAMNLLAEEKFSYRGQPGVGEVLHYAHLLTESLPNHQKQRAVVVTYFYLNVDFKSNVVKNGIHTSYIIEQLQEVASQDITPKEKAITLTLLGFIQDVLCRESEVIKAFEQALSEIEKEPLASATTESREELEYLRRTSVIALSEYFTESHQYQRAFDLSVQSYDHDRTERHGWMRKIVQLSLHLDPSGKKAMDILKSLTKAERTRYLRTLYDQTSWSRSMARPILQCDIAPRRTGEMTLWMTWLSQIPRDRRLDAQSAMAFIYEEFLHDLSSAKQIRLKIFAWKPAPYNTPRQIVMNKRVQEANWRQHAMAIYRQFTSATDFDFDTRENVLAEMDSLPILHFQQSNELEDSHVGMLRVYMLRSMGPFREYKAAADSLFAACIANLSDGVSYNDGPSLRLLAKVLSLMPGLERDVSIAYSAQFSILDREIQQNETKGNVSYADDEDLTGVSYPCGGCKRSLSRWTAAQYMCLVCPNLDLCETCFAKEQESHSRAPRVSNPDENGMWEDELWHPFCDSTHAYIKGPMNGWKGVKGGMIRLEDREVEVRQWLADLRDSDWKMAWEKLWRTQGSLRNIGVNI